MLVPHAALRPQMPHPLAGDRVRYVGEPVAIVAAEDPYLAEDALELIEVRYEQLPAVVDAETALKPGAPLLHEDAESNLAATVTQRVGDPDVAFAHADVVLGYNFRFGRLSGQPLETRGVVAVYERTKVGESFIVWDSTQSPHTARRVLAEMLRVPLHAIRVIAPDVGGGFGIKNRLYAEEFLVPFLARHLGCPVRWIEDRREDLLTTYQAREQAHHLEVAASRDGTIQAIRDRLWPTTARTHHSAWSPHSTRPPRCRAPIGCATTTSRCEPPTRTSPAWLPIAPRGDRRPPYRLGLTDRDGSEVCYDSGDYPTCLRKAIELADVAAFRRQQEEERTAGRYLGLGLGCYVESTGRGPFEGATVRVEPSGEVVVMTGSAPQGQSHETTLAQLCADRLGVNLDAVTVVTGDTAAIPLGVGTYASRSAVVAGNAVSVAARAVRDKAIRMAAQMLETSPQDLELRQGIIWVRGVPESQISLARVASVVSSPPPAFIFPEGLEPGLEATHYFHPIGNTYANGVHVAIVEVDVETGIVSLLRYVVVHDCGTVINPAVVDGQVHGGVGQGIGNALLEEMVYDAAGQPLTTSYLDYLLPTAMEVPPIELGHHETPSPLNPEASRAPVRVARCPPRRRSRTPSTTRSRRSASSSQACGK